MKIFMKNLKLAYKFVQNLFPKRQIISNKRQIETENGNYNETIKGNYIQKQLNFYPETPSNLNSPSYEFYITICNNYDYWQESEKPIREPYPFKDLCKQYFHLNEKYFVENVQPYFDITFSNKMNEPILLTHVGIEIVSVCHLIYPYGIPECIEVKIRSENVISMPNISTRLGDKYMTRSYEREPLIFDANEVISTKMPSPFQLEHQAVFRYTLLLDKYQEHMPNNSILRMYAKTSNGKEFRSDEIHLFTL